MERPIGVIDSGVGGLTVVDELMRQLPREQLIYLGDTKRCPYGPRTKEEVQQFTWEMVNFLLKKDIKMLVIACNTATAFAMEELKEQLHIPVIGVINPGSRAAIKATMNEQVGVIGTEGTIKSGAYKKALKNINPKLTIEAIACPLFVPLVEQGIFSGDEAETVVASALYPFTAEKRIDTLILGCTHYPLLKAVIQDALGEDVTVISSSEETAREISAVLELKGLQNNIDMEPTHTFYTTGDMDLFQQIAKHIFNTEQLEQVNIKSAIIDKPHSMHMI